jgi:hypothetical protein
LAVGRDDDYDEIDMSFEEEEGFCLINKLKTEDHGRKELLDMMDKCIKRIEEKVPRSAKHVRLLRRYLDLMDENIIK